MRLLILGRGKTGALIAEIASQRSHQVRVVGSAENIDARALTAANLRAADVVVDFTTPQSVLPNIRACLEERKNVVVGTTGWYASLPEIRQAVEQAGTGFVYASNFSVGVNIFFQIAGAASAAVQRGYAARIVERHHAQKKDAPSGTAVTLRDFLQPEAGSDSRDTNDKNDKIEITSIREGDAVGQHVIFLDSADDSIMLVHDAKSRRGFALGAVLAAEWIAGKRGFYEFREILPQLER